MIEREEKLSDHCQETMEIILPSPYENCIWAFDNEESSPDLTFMIQGLGKPLRLHQGLLSKTSKYVERVLKEKREKGEDDCKVEWAFGPMKEVDKQVIVKALRFCYGESVSVGVKNGECCAMVSVLKKLKVTCDDIVIEDLIAFARDESKKDLKTGVELLKCVEEYQECIGKRMDEILAFVVFTKKNMMEHYDVVVDDCLMKLPSKYLDMVEYEEGHGEKSEFGVKARFIREHKELEKEEKERLMKNCRWDDLNLQKLKELKELDVVEGDSLWNICETLLKRDESEIDVHKKEIERERREKEKLRKQSLSSFLFMNPILVFTFCL